MNQQAFLKSINPLIPGGDNLEQTVVFYEQKLGFKRIHQEGAPIYMAIVKRDSFQLFLLKNGTHGSLIFSGVRKIVDDRIRVTDFGSNAIANL